LQDLREDGGVELAKRLCRAAADIHAQAGLQVNDDVEGAFNGSATALLVATLDSSARGVKEANDAVIERDNQIHG
jgi:hypothetical protein